MSDEDRGEAESLIVAYLTSNLNKYPNGVTLQEFERNYHVYADEERLWFRRYGKKSPSEVLEWVRAWKGDLSGFRVHYDNRSGNTFISLNKKSDKVDSHLVDLVSNQRSSSKRKGKSSSSRGPGHFLQRSSDDFHRMNRNYSSHGTNRINPRLNPVSYNAEPRRFAAPPMDQRRGPPSDPRASRSMVPPQVSMKPMPSSSSGPPAKQPRSQPAPPPPKPAPASATVQPPRVTGDPTLEHKKSIVRQRLLHMLTKRYPEIRLLYLGSMYQMEFDEPLDPSLLGYKDLTKLIEDPFFGEYIKINYNSKPLVTVSTRNVCNEKENIASSSGNRLSGLVDDSTTNPLADRSNNLTGSRAKYDAIDIFNVTSMLNSLRPLETMTESPLGNNAIEDCIKYRTLRTIICAPDKTLRLDDWELRYQDECKCKIRIQIRDYGFKTLLEFFKHLSLELPIKIRLNDKDEWVAIGDLASTSEWVKKNISAGKYRVMTVLNRSYEQIAYPDDTYNYAGLKDLPNQEFYQAYIMAINCDKSQDSQRYDMWIQLRTPKRIEEHLCIEGSLVCYEDFKKKDWLSVPAEFIVKGFPCVAFDKSQQRWCRARISKVPQVIDQNANISAVLVDYGVTRTFTLPQLRCILKNHLKHPIGLINAKIHNVENDRSLAAKITLQEYVSPAPVNLACKIVASYETGGKKRDSLPKVCYNVTLIDTRDVDNDRNLADLVNSYANATGSPDE